LLWVLFAHTAANVVLCDSDASNSPNRFCVKKANAHPHLPIRPESTTDAPQATKEKAMATLELKTLRCIRRKDLTGKDEPRIKVDGDPVWNGVVAKDGSVAIDVTAAFDGEVSVIAEEMNNTKPKQIGAAVLVRESGNPKFLTFKTSGAWYEVDFEVTA
jgi:hypothetical protein